MGAESRSTIQAENDLKVFFSGFHFQYSAPVNWEERVNSSSRCVTRLPLHESRLRTNTLDEAEGPGSTDRNVVKRDSLVRWVTPECPPEKVGALESLFQLLLDLATLSASLSYDLYSYRREDIKPSKLTSMTLLMQYYGYSEAEAIRILRQEILGEEQKLRDKYRKWESSSATISDSLRTYSVLLMLAAGGSNYWMSRHLGSETYDTGLDNQKGDYTPPTEVDPHNLLRLEGYEPPCWIPSRVKTYAISQSVSESDSEGIKVKSASDSDLKYNVLTRFQKADSEKICMEPFVYTKDLPGKNTVSKFIMSLRPWLNIPDTSASVLKDVMTALQNASLMLDDIEDGSTLRRGAPAAHVKYGVSQTINSTIYVLAEVLSKVHAHLRPECSKAFSDEIQILALGQGLDLNWTFHEERPTVQEYLTMIDHKTGGFFRLILRAMEIEADTTPNEDLRHLITLLGRYYQIKDDYQNLASEEYTSKKGFCDDLSEGKFSFPLIHLLENSPNADDLHRMVFKHKQEKVTEEEKVYILSEMQRMGSLKHTKGILTELFDCIWETTGTLERQLGENKRLKSLCLILKL
ncbi:isoprenoid synthase domain-containing protein [Aspergillus avenaceus]|uniref:Isoprenoid synthase domain-containing protein n=1 Tax=Aspergillus avenaceus TaxID=36643 RepID=A0A5N6UA29_ASPAV|nr:isoprenoid synthase domain-containing protein [Aspergillus avenaceus]